MSKKITLQMHYAASVEDAYAMMTDPAYVTERAEKTGGRDVTVAVDSIGAETTIKLDRSLPAEVPSFAQKFVGETIDVAEEQVWTDQGDGTHHGTMDITFGGAPVHVKGTLDLRPDGDGCVCVVQAEIKSSVPLIGGKIEGVVAEQIERAVHKEEQVGHDWLAAH